MDRRLSRRALVRGVHRNDSRAKRYRHLLSESMNLHPAETAVMCVLMLRGAQTEGELRTRASRMEPIADLDTLRAVLRKLADRKLIVFLTPEDRRGTTVTHGFYSPEELERLRSRHGGETAAHAERESPPVRNSQVDEMQAQINALQTQVADLQKTVANLDEQLRSLKLSLGA